MEMQALLSLDRKWQRPNRCAWKCNKTTRISLLLRICLQLLDLWHRADLSMTHLRNRNRSSRWKTLKSSNIIMNNLLRMTTNNNCLLRLVKTWLRTTVSRLYKENWSRLINRSTLLPRMSDRVLTTSHIRTHHKKKTSSIWLDPRPKSLKEVKLPYSLPNTGTTPNSLINKDSRNNPLWKRERRSEVMLVLTELEWRLDKLSCNLGLKINWKLECPELMSWTKWVSAKTSTTSREISIRLCLKWSLLQLKMTLIRFINTKAKERYPPISTSTELKPRRKPKIKPLLRLKHSYLLVLVWCPKMNVYLLSKTCD